MFQWDIRTIFLWLGGISDAIGFWFWISNTVQLTRASYQKDRAVMRGEIFSAVGKKTQSLSKSVAKRIRWRQKKLNNNLIELPLFIVVRSRSSRKSSENRP